MGYNSRKYVGVVILLRTNDGVPGLGSGSMIHR